MNWHLLFPIGWCVVILFLCEKRKKKAAALDASCYTVGQIVCSITIFVLLICLCKPPAPPSAVDKATVISKDYNE